MASSVDSVNISSDFVKDNSCDSCKNKNIEASADIFCETCLKCFCEKCIYYHDQIFVNHLKYGRGEINKWPIAKTIEDLLLKCDVHNNEKLKMFCQDHSQLCCSDCVSLNHMQCTNLALISESASRPSVDMQQLSKKIQTILAELNKFTKIAEASIQSVKGSYSEKLQDIRELRKKLNAYLDKLENATLKILDEIRTTLQNSLKKDFDNCCRLKNELQQLGEAVHGLCDKSKKEMEFIANRKCLDKIQECETYLKEGPVKIPSSISFQEDSNIDQYLSKKSSLGTIVDGMLSLTHQMNPDQVLAVKRKSEYNVKISSDTKKTCSIIGICSLPSGQFIGVDNFNKEVKLFDQNYNVISHYKLYDTSMVWDICHITYTDVAVLVSNGVQFMSVSNGQLVNGGKLQLPHCALGIAHHQGALYITSGSHLYHYTLTGTLVKQLYEDKGIHTTVYKCAVSPAGDRIYITDPAQHKLITLATDGSLISTFTDHALQNPCGVHVSPAGQLLVCVCVCGTGALIQVDHEGRKKLATLYSHTDVKYYPGSVCCNPNTDQIIVGLCDNNKIIVMDLK